MFGIPFLQPASSNQLEKAWNIHQKKSFRVPKKWNDFLKDKNQ